MAVAVWAREASPGGSDRVWIGAILSTGLGRRVVSRPAAAARRRGAEMNETYAASTSEGYPGITQILNTIPNLNWVMQV